MTSRHALLPAVTAAVVLVLAIVLPFAGCGLPLQGLSSDVDAGSPCNADSQCTDQNACTVDTCVAGACSHVAQPDGPAPSSSQTAYDCKVVACVKGMPGTQNDDLDIQADSEDCTVDQCNAGSAFHTAKPEDTPCTMGGDGICKSGKCQITCTVDSMCDDQNPCTTDTCDVAQGLCSFAPLNGVSTPGAAQIDFDCNIQVCVDGVDTKSPDDSDLPKTATDCDQELCNNGVPSNPPLADTVSCGPNKARICDGAGTCVECNSPTQCPGIDEDCQVRSCAGHVCGITFSPLGTPRAAPFQTTGDCKVVVCDGAGSSTAQPQNDDTDKPVDGNNCTMDVCSSGVPSHPFEMMGTGCGVNSACDALGQCGCANDAACVAPTTCGGGNPGTTFVCGCTKKSCAALGKTCGSVTDGCFATQNCDNGSKEGTETDVDCGGAAAGSCGTTCGQGKQCNVDGDCTSGHCADGVCCNVACTGTCLACSAAKKGGGTDGSCGSIALGLQDPNATMTCVGNKVCDGANNCKKIDGQSCNGNNECVSGSCADGVCCNTACNGTCQACSSAKKGGGPDGVCGNIPINQPDNAATVTCTGTSSCDGNGTCKKNVGQACANGSQCVNGNCVDGVCCGSASCGTCQSCNLATPGTCTNVASGNVDNNPVGTCTGSNVCDGTGVCKKVNGQICSVNAECVMGNCVDGYCCNSACTATCKACNVAGSLGACTNIAAGTGDTNATMTCIGTSTCDGSGTCKKSDGQTCSASGECLNANCVDGYCCNSACSATCMACNVSGSLGTCSNIAVNQPDTSATMTCVSPSSCDGGGACKKNDGQTCSANAECLHGSCADGFCCNTTCQGTCLACNVVGLQGTCSNIVSGMPDNNATTTCSGTSVCDGGGNCKLTDGQACGASAECVHNSCADGYCCDSSCTGQCKACNVSGSEGTCSNLPINAPDNNASLVCTLLFACDGAGSCKSATGQPCTTNTQCASGVCTAGLTCQ